MKTHRIILGVILSGIISSPAAAQVFVSGSTGADGAFAPAADTTLQLPPGGTFNFTTVTIPAGVTVTFAKNAANTPVTILATGDVTINGTLSVNGTNGGPSLASLPNPQVGQGGPGGYNGGAGGNPGAVNVTAGLGGAGLGIGSGGGGGTGQGCSSFGYSGCGGTFPTTIPALLPMLGGSGGGGGGGRVTGVGNSGGAGGGGAGSIIIASSGTITVGGSLTANGGLGGSGLPDSYGGGGGSGGGIRLVANTIAGSGSLAVTGGTGGPAWSGGGGNGGNGIVRLESFAFTYSGAVLPGASFATPGLVAPPGLPSLTIASIGGSAPPANPAGNFSTVDVSLPPSVTNPVPVVVAATDIPVNTGIRIEVRPQFGVVTSHNGSLTGTQSSSSATVNATLPSGVSVIQVVTNAFTITADLAPYLPLIDGEPVEQIRLAAAYGAGSQVFYITKSGKEVPAERYFGRVVATK